MLIAIAFFAGIAIGWSQARRRGGDLYDKLQYSAVYALIFSVVTVIAIIVIGNLTAAPQ